MLTSFISFTRKIWNRVLGLSVTIESTAATTVVLLVELPVKHGTNFFSYGLLDHLHRQLKSLNLMPHFVSFFYSEELLKKTQIRTY